MQSRRQISDRWVFMRRHHTTIPRPPVNATAHTRRQPQPDYRRQHFYAHINGIRYIFMRVKMQIQHP